MTTLRACGALCGLWGLIHFLVCRTYRCRTAPFETIIAAVSDDSNNNFTAEINFHTLR
jgi:hypothetical protein